MVRFGSAPRPWRLQAESWVSAGGRARTLKGLQIHRTCCSESKLPTSAESVSCLPLSGPWVRRWVLVSATRV